MSFREKSAWITLVALVLVTAMFVLHLPRPWTLAPQSTPFLILVVAISTATFLVIEIVGHIVIAARAPREANAPQDERERLISLKATQWSAYVYAFLTIGCTGLVGTADGANAIGLAYCILLSFQVAEIVNYAARIHFHRRGV